MRNFHKISFSFHFISKKIFIYGGSYEVKNKLPFAGLKLTGKVFPTVKSLE